MRDQCSSSLERTPLFYLGSALSHPRRQNVMFLQGRQQQLQTRWRNSSCTFRTWVITNCGRASGKYKHLGNDVMNHSLSRKVNITSQRSHWCSETITFLSCGKLVILKLKHFLLFETTNMVPVKMLSTFFVLFTHFAVVDSSFYDNCRNSRALIG